MDTLNLTKFFITQAQARSFAESLARVSEQVYSTDFNLEKSLLDQLGLVKKDLFLQLLQENSISANSTAAVKKFIDDVIAKTNTLPTLTLTIAIEPDEQLLKAVMDWCELNIGTQVVLAIKVNPQLIGGTTMSFGGKFFDFSLKPAFDKFITEHSQAQPKAPPLLNHSHDKTRILSNID